MAIRRQKLGLMASLLGVTLLAGCNSAGMGVASSDSAARAPSAVAGWSGSSAARCIETADEDQLASQILTLINLERAQLAVAPVTLNPALTKAAEDYACTMAAEDFFAHYHPETGEGPADRATGAGYVFYGVGENLASGQTTAAEAVEGWMDSPGHRENLLSPNWKETGIGVRHSPSYRTYWVQLFGQPRTYGPVARASATDLAEPESWDEPLGVSEWEQGLSETPTADEWSDDDTLDEAETDLNALGYTEPGDEVADAGLPEDAGLEDAGLEFDDPILAESDEEETYAG